MKNYTVAILSIVFGSFLFAQPSVAQQPTHHTVIVKSKLFTDSELSELSQKLESDHQFSVRGACNSEGLIVIDIPVSLSIRVNHAEEIIVSAIESSWSESASIEKTKSALEVMQCED